MKNILIVTAILLASGQNVSAARLNAAKCQAAPLIYINTAKNIAVGAAAAITGYHAIQTARQNNQAHIRNSQQSKTITTTRK